MNCKECKELLVEYIEDRLEASQRRNTAVHLEQCSDCRREAEAVQTILKRLVEDNREAMQSPLRDAVMNRILKVQNVRLKAVNSVSFTSRLRVLIIKNSLVRAAAVAVVIIAIVVGLYSPNNNVTFAEVVEPVLNARTLIYDIVVRPGPKETIQSHDVAVDRKIRKTFPYFEPEMILDIDNAQLVLLDPVRKAAAIINAENASVDSTQDFLRLFDSERNFLRLVRSGIDEALNGPQSAVEELGWENIDGLDVTGFKLSPGIDGEEVVIWADTDTALPVQIDIRLGNSHMDNPGTKMFYTLKNIEFNVPVDESLVEVPPEYRLMDSGRFMIIFYEDKFFNALRIYTKYWLQGFFPETLTDEDLLGLMIPGLSQINQYKKLKAMSPEEIEELTIEERISLVTPGPSVWEKLDPEEEEEIPGIVGFGVLFLAYLEESGADWQYSGNGVQLGEQDREIFRHLPPDSQSWRVVYGDLHFEEVPVVNPSR